jgi:hypothetical protein
MDTIFTDTTSRDDEPVQALRLITASQPTSPGPSTPTVMRTLPLGDAKPADDDDIVPPARPSSTPFPRQGPLEDDECMRWTNIPEVLQRSLTSTGLNNQDFTPNRPNNTNSPNLCTLPVEVQEHILDYCLKFRNSAAVKSKGSQTKALRNWGHELRHSRRREVSDLALVSERWKDLVQDRLYRHIKIKATRESVDQATSWFHYNPHLCAYVKNIEFWFPVFQPKALDVVTIRTTVPNNRSSTNLIQLPMPGLPEEPFSNLTYQSPCNNCTLEEVFRFVQLTFSNAVVLTLEGGDRKKPPQVQHFKKSSTSRSLPVLETIEALDCKGQWNLFRTNDEFQNIVAALPNLTEWHGKYAKPKSKSYLCMATIFPSLPYNLTILNISLENDFRREAVSPSFFRKVGLKTHFCVDMAKAMPGLERFEYTGRVCHCFFDIAASLSDARTSKLKSIHMTVKNCCRSGLFSFDGSGITDMAFIYAFEALVLSGVRALDRLTALDSLRLKFIDLGK